MEILNKQCNKCRRVLSSVIICCNYEWRHGKDVTIFYCKQCYHSINCMLYSLMDDVQEKCYKCNNQIEIFLSDEKYEFDINGYICGNCCNYKKNVK